MVARLTEGVDEARGSTTEGDTAPCPSRRMGQQLIIAA
jgi:hypothetical protein